MSGRVILRATEGPNRGEVYVFESHDVFIFGRDPECHACLGGTDTSASRQHFLLEVSPPAVRVRDLGSRNGTFIGERRIGGGDGRPAEVDLVDGDVLRVGTSAFVLKIELPVSCERCKREIRPESADAWAHAGPTNVCIHCRVLPPRPAAAAAMAPVACRACGSEIAGERSADDPLRMCNGCLARWADDPLALLEPGSIAGVAVDRLLAVDATGASYLGRRIADATPVAIHARLARTRVTPAMRDAFVRELEQAGQLKHPNLVPLHAHGSSGPVFWSVTESGTGTVAAAIQVAGGRLSPAEALALAMTALAGLAHLHAHAVVHRDLKPANLLVAGPGVAKIGEVGLARAFGRAGLAGMTMTGATAGAVRFMPREQLLNFKATRPQADVFSFGAILYTMLTGVGPREASPAVDPLLTVLRGPTVPIRQRDPQLPAALAAVVDRACAPAWKDRQAHAGELLAELQRAV
ncbi:protein kinase domain-containing protein [Nannocystis radixulma]|uniref:Serine/threonine-protein kinase n=1 Tax=Nannocystis radixulma TaxID=2995305 RepID=A0ABT5BEI2_9BACT|nr:FHA domain-containing serine/threonine-protein kinase [Nannocystis radixulma]MDC0672553.1 serine/threonine-protein kinase [Nannocystis radixulma]